jgi:hypothetical protein
MTEDDLYQEFSKLMDAVQHTWETTYSADELEPDLLNVLNFTKQNLESKETLIQFFISLVKEKKWRGDIEVIEFCMHEFRWPEVKQAVEEIVATTQDIRERDALCRIPRAFSDDWDGVQFYSYYSRK